MSETEIRVKNLISYLQDKKEVSMWEWIKITGYSESMVAKLFTLATQENSFIIRRKGRLILTE